MTNEQKSTNTGKPEHHKQNLPQPLVRNIQLVRKNFEESNVQESTTSYS